MFTIIAEETNNYAHQQIARIMGRRDEIQQLEHYSHKRHARLGTWRDINEADIKIFITHILIMPSVRKPALHNYWSTITLSRTSFFGTYLSRNKFQDILWNLQKQDSMANISLKILSTCQILKERLPLADVKFAISLMSNWLIMDMNI